MQLLKNFGLDPVLLVAQIVNFLIVLYVLKRFLYKPVLSMLDERKKTIKEGIERAAEGQRMLEDASHQQKKLLKEAHDQATLIIADAKKAASSIVSETETTMKKRTDKMIKEAEIQIMEEAKKTEERLSSHVSALAVQFLQQALKDLFTEKDQEEIMVRAIKQLKKSSN